MRAVLLLFGLLPVLWAAACSAGRDEPDARIAVASNFREAALALEQDFEDTSGYDISPVFGATGQLYAQISNGAPYDVMLSADRDRPERLVADGLAVEDSRFTYATGKLVLWSADEARLAGKEGPDILIEDDFRALAIANPDLAPYGAAAMQTLQSLGLSQTLSDKLVRGQSIGQTYSMVASGNAELGFVASSQVLTPSSAGGAGWPVPVNLHEPIRQDAVLLMRANDNAAARRFMDYLKSPDARRIIQGYGYETG
ncbi:MAG: molybdate ABC transporter substrate-binding protein [Henriciella sp.]|uniref:molybdate ABC transporter substrate-binding protein n=1 Tax=Henriciella sp. TaxID=1968823 RepID=UPI003C70B8F7